MDIWSTPTYTPAMAARLTNLRPERVRRWLHGYRFTYPLGPDGDKVVSEKSSVIRTNDENNQRYASFLELIDLIFVKQFIDSGISLQRLRKALEEAENTLGERHFANKRFFSDGREVYLKIESQIDSKVECLLQLLSGGQWAIPEIVKRTAQQIDFDTVTDYAVRWYPPSGKNRIVLDPRVSFGAPTIVKRGIKTINIYDLYLAENESVSAVSKWMGLEKIEVQSAVDFEMKLAA